MTAPVYLDYAATTPAAPEVRDAMWDYLGPDGVFGNPASRIHRFGGEAHEAVREARAEVAELIHAEPGEIVWTSGATESINLAIKGTARARADRGHHIITSALEHKAVLDTCAYLEESEGCEVTYLKPGEDGLITPAMVEGALRPDTILVSLMHVNNETGVITDIDAIAELTRERGVPFHVDAAQSAGRLPLDMTNTKADLVSMSAHKLYGPKGIGALYVRRRPPACLTALIHGGGHEWGMRSGTLPTHQIVGMGKAAQLVRAGQAADSKHIGALSKRLIKHFQRLGQVSLNGDRSNAVPGIVNVSFAQVDADSLVMALAEQDIAVSSGSACTSASFEPSHVLLAMGLDAERSLGAVRFSIGRFTTRDEIDRVGREVEKAVTELRALATCNLEQEASDPPAAQGWEGSEELRRVAG